jgi:hypothetical protein
MGEKGYTVGMIRRDEQVASIGFLDANWSPAGCLSNARQVNHIVFGVCD